MRSGLYAIALLAAGCFGVVSGGDELTGGGAATGGGSGGGAAGGSAGGEAGGSSGGVAAGAAGGDAGGATGGASGGTAGGTAGGSAGGAAGGSAGGSAGGAAGGSAGGSAGGAAGGAAGGSGGGSTADGGTYGVPVNGFPSSRERAIVALTNAVRISPTDYKASSVYASNTPPLNIVGVLGAAYPARPPLYWDLDLNQSSRQHSQEMATLNYFAHNSIDGGSADLRIHSYYVHSGAWGENIAAGNSAEIATMHQWLCDSVMGSGVCTNDGSGNDGHRSNIMSNQFQVMGAGYGSNASATYRYYWTQDFGGTLTSPKPPLVDGAHLLGAQTRFIASFYAAAAAQSVSVVLDGVMTPMAVDLGTAARGTWFVARPTASACRSYFFVAVDSANVTWRFPAAGTFRTRGEGTCAEEYVP